MSKLIYKAERPYQEDTNDLVAKGGAGSGIKGHLTYKDHRKHEQMRQATKTGRLQHIQGALKHFESERDNAHKDGRKEHAEHYGKLANEARSHIMSHLKRNEK